MEDEDEVEVEGGFESASEEAGRAKQNAPFPLLICSFVPLFPGGMGERRSGAPLWWLDFAIAWMDVGRGRKWENCKAGHKLINN